MASKLTHDELIALLRKMQNGKSLRTFAKELEVSAPFLSDVYRGRRTPGNKILSQLGLRKITTVSTIYEKEKKA